MAHSFNDDEKEVREFAQSMPFGVNVVQVTGAIADQNAKGTDYIEVGVVNEQGVEDSAKLYFTGGASNISFNTLRQIAVHCAESEEDKETARQRVDAVKDSDELAAVISELCTGKQIWFTKYYAADGSTYTNEYGTFKSVQKSVLGYEPKERPDLMPNKESADDRDERKAGNDPLAGAEPASKEAADNIPSDWAK